MRDRLLRFSPLLPPTTSGHRASAIRARPSLRGPVPPPFFKAASCGVSFRRARGALRCYAQNLSSTSCRRVSWPRENFARSFASSVYRWRNGRNTHLRRNNNSRQHPLKIPDGEERDGGRRKSAREKGRKNNVARENNRRIASAVMNA